MKIYFDGGCKPNPGVMEVCVVIAPTREVTHEKAGHGTNNQAEWLALVTAATIADHRGFSDAEFVGDSLLVINQAKGEWKCKHAELKPMLDEFHILHKKNPNWRLTHVLRHLNLAGIHLETTPA